MNKNKKPGPTSIYGEPMQRVSIFAPQTLIAAMKCYGNGSKSAGFRRAAEEVTRDEIPFDGYVPFSDELEDEGIPEQYGLQPVA